MYVREIVLSYRTRPGPVDMDSDQRLSRPSDAAAVVTSLLAHEVVEVFVILCLSTKHGFDAYYEVSRGSLDKTIVHPRDVFKAALIANSAALILAHNHPSGDPTPSRADIEMTAEIKAAGAVLSIVVHDHLIVGNGRHLSFRREGLL